MSQTLGFSGKSEAEATRSFEARKFVEQRYRPLYSFAVNIVLAGQVALAVGVLAGFAAAIAFMPEHPGMAFVGFLTFSGAGAVTFGLSQISAAALRAFADTAVWTSAGMTDDDKLALVRTMDW